MTKILKDINGFDVMVTSIKTHGRFAVVELNPLASNEYKKQYQVIDLDNKNTSECLCCCRSLENANMIASGLDLACALVDEVKNPKGDDNK